MEESKNNESIFGEGNEKDNRIKTLLFILNLLFGTNKENLEKDFQNLLDILYNFFKIVGTDKIIIFMFKIIQNPGMSVFGPRRIHIHSGDTGVRESRQ